jgi:hypothetical protein
MLINQPLHLNYLLLLLVKLSLKLISLIKD